VRVEVALVRQAGRQVAGEGVVINVQLFPGIFWAEAAEKGGASHEYRQRKDSECREPFCP